MQAATRRHVTIVTSDLKGSTALGERLDPESLREVLSLYFDEMRAVLEAQGGSIEKIIGDAIVAVFADPEADTDGESGAGPGRRRDTPPTHPLRAVRAAFGTKHALIGLNERLEARWGVRLTVRTGVATGDAVIGDEASGDHILTGAVVALANKLEQSAPGGEILIAEPTYRAVAARVRVDAVEPVVPKGEVDPQPAWLLVHVDPEAASLEFRREVEGHVGPRFQETRKTVTIVFSDLRATTLAGDPLAPEVLRATMARAFEAARIILARHGGTVEKFIGDAVMAVFGLPVRHEDDGLRAARAGLEMQTALSSLAEALADEGIRLAVATGVNTGEVVAGDASLGQRLVTGDAVNVAARLEQAAPVGAVYMGELTYGLVRDAVDVEEVEPLTLKGKSQPVAAYRLRGVHSADAYARRQDAPMVGRDAEMALLRDAFESSRRDRVARMVTLVGEAGVGKTRLAQEFLASVAGDARIVRGRCLPYGDGITFWPIGEVVREAAVIREDDAADLALRRLADLIGPSGQDITDRVATAIGLHTVPFQMAELYWGIRRFFEELAGDRPVVVRFDDIHWAEATFLDLISNLVDTVGAPVTILCTSRQSLLDDHADWATRTREARIDLAPLGDADAAQVVENLLGTAGLADDVRQRIVASAEGNPLFVEQLLSMLIDRGMLTFEDGRWTGSGDLSALSIPPTIHALLASRLDQLSTDERAVVDPAAVIGLNFAIGAVRELADQAVREDIPIHLDGLARRQLVRVGAVTVDTEAAYRFAHILVRDAAYQGLLKRSRADYHERFVVWADRVNAEAGRATEFEEILGYHLEQAYRYRSELGPLDAAGVATGIAASERLGSAGRRAFARGDMPAAANLLERAAGLVPSDHRSRPRLLLKLAEARMEMGDYDAADALLETAARAADEASSDGVEAAARLTRLMFRWLVDPADLEGDPDPLIEDAITVMRRTGEEDGLVTAWRFRANLCIAATDWEGAAKAAEQVIEHARRAGDRAAELRAGPTVAMAAAYGPSPIREALRLAADLLAHSGGDRKAEALIRRTIGRLEAMEGRFDEARTEVRAARAALEELGFTFQAALTSLDSGPIEMLAGEPAAAVDELQRDFDALDRLGERNFISTTAAQLADALYRSGRFEEADTKAAFSAEVADPDDYATQYLWRAVRSRLLVRAGERAEAEAMAREAARLTTLSGDRVDQANALLNLAEVLGAAGRGGEAAAAAEDALGRYEAKGLIVGAAQARAFLAGVPAGR